ncbi:MAG: IS5 family transposase [Sphingomonadaceae bacterium]|nr:IS5 family transposase [Sphingomonadaceae bacterium]
MLERIAGLIDWGSIEAFLAGLHSSRYGRPAYPPLVLFKALLLQQWYALSEVRLEEALGDRLSFRRFCGLALEDDAPDQVTIGRFRNLLTREQLVQPLFEEIVRQIDARGLILRQGTLIDASLVEAAVKRPKPPKDESPEASAATQEPDASLRPASKLVKSPLDPDAAWAKKGGKRTFGYKVHVGADQGSAIIRRALLTPANVNDTVPADDLYCGDEKAVYADQAYSTHARTARLKAAGIRDRTMTRPNKHHPLTERQKTRNKAIGRRRGPVEQVFARLKGTYDWARVRYRGLAANQAQLLLICCAMNLKRMAVLTKPA